MKRKFQIASSIIHKPQLLIWDEPFNTLDSGTVEMVKQIIQEYTIIFTTHDYHLAEAIATKQLIIKNKQIEEIR